MSMASYPFMLWGAFLIDEEVAKHMAPLVNCNADDFDFEEIMDEFEDRVCRVGQFDGEAEPMLYDRVEEAKCREYSDDTVYYLPAKQEAGLFRIAYSSPDELLKEHKETIRNMGIVLPDDFDWWGHIVDIYGTYFC